MILTWGTVIRLMSITGLLLTITLLAKSGEAAPPGVGGGKTDLTINLQVVDSGSSPVVLGEVIGINKGLGLYVALSPSLANADPPLIVLATVSNPAGVTLVGTDILYYTDATCSTTPYFTVPVSIYTPTGVVATSSGTMTTYQIYRPGSGQLSSGLIFNSRRDPTGPTASSMGACNNTGESYDAIQAEATPYTITLAPPLKLKNP